MVTGTMLLDLHVLPDLRSKSNLCFDVLKQVYDTTQITDNKIGNGIQVFWGLGHNNKEKIRRCIYKSLPWLFIDMPYWNRWTKHDLEWSKTNAHWRFIPNGLHPDRNVEMNMSRLNMFNLGPFDFDKDGNTIVICPSSQSVTNFYLGVTVDQWISTVVNQCNELYPQFNTIVRHKPRKHGTSGPDVADVSIQEELRPAAATVSLLSICAIDGIANGVPSMVTNTNISTPGGNISTLLGEPFNSNIEDVTNRLETLASHQYSLLEILNNNLDELLKCYLLM